MSEAAAINRDLEAEAPAAYHALSDLGRRAVYPKGIPYQAGQARDALYNSTIGLITDGAQPRGALPLPVMDAVLKLTSAADRTQAFLYAPVSGVEELRERWSARQRRGQDAAVPSTLPLTTVGLTHGLSILADLFVSPGRAVAIPEPFWGNYRQVFALRSGGKIHSAPSFRDGRFLPSVIADALADLPPGEPALAVVNFPSNPGGYAPAEDERQALKASLLDIAAQRPLVVVCDDAYAGLVYEAGIPTSSLFWELAGSHPNLLAVKVDGGTKEFSFFGGRVGFLTFGLPASSGAARALESKVMFLLRATIGSPVANSQVMLLHALRSPTVEDEIANLRTMMAGRYRALKAAFAAADRELLQPMPFNAGCFAVVELPAAVEAEALRLHLIAKHSTGIISIPPRLVRIAFCSVAAENLAELVARLERGVRELATTV